MQHLMASLLSKFAANFNSERTGPLLKKGGVGTALQGFRLVWRDHATPRSTDLDFMLLCGFSLG